MTNKKPPPIYPESMVKVPVYHLAAALRWRNLVWRIREWQREQGRCIRQVCVEAHTEEEVK